MSRTGPDTATSVATSRRVRIDERTGPALLRPLPERDAPDAVEQRHGELEELAIVRAERRGN